MPPYGLSQLAHKFEYSSLFLTAIELEGGNDYKKTPDIQKKSTVGRSVHRPTTGYENGKRVDKMIECETNRTNKRRATAIERKDYGTGIPRHEIEALACCMLPEIEKFFESEDGKKEFAEWKVQYTKGSQ